MKHNNTTFTLSNNWHLLYDDKKIKANVPGDITIDIYNAGEILDPYFAENYKKAYWITRRDFTYEYELEVSKELYSHDVIELIFKGIDLYSNIYINDTLLGSTKNMFLKYTYDIKPHVHVGKNIIKVDMFSTLNKMDTFDTKDYFSIFNVPRIFTRKAQCHFGWDWAPKICGYGIWDDVIISAHNKEQIDNVKVVARKNGDLSFFFELNHSVRELPEGSEKEYINVYVSKTPNGDEYIKDSIEVTGIKNFINFKFDNPELWWPVGYGAHPLYNYKVELVKGDKILDLKEGRFGFRDVTLKEEVVGKTSLGFTFYVNDVAIFAKGSNWIPIECFTGVVKDEKYEEMIKLAVAGNLNTLRVWGGGIYEKDIFYNLCDEYGLLVWQDICLACADIPEEDEEFSKNMIEEVEYQVKRLRNHPSLIYWCGGNEKTGTYGLMITHGDFFVNNLLYGVVMHLDDTRAYRRQSPFSHTDIGNEKNSGESHHNVFEISLTNGMENYRKKLNEVIPTFVSESAIMGPSSLETMKKIFPVENLWPMDEMWKDRLMENPYGVIPLDFPHRELKYANDLYGEVTSLEDFIPKAMMAHAEAMRAECEFIRAHKGFTSGFLNWMYGDIWPSGTWSIVDYYLEPKQVYYQLKRSFKPILASFYQDKEENVCLFVSNDTLEDVVINATVYEKTFNGEVVSKEEFKDIKVNNRKAVSLVLSNPTSNDNYKTVEYTVNGEAFKTIYSHDMYAHKTFEENFDYDLELINPNHAQLKVKANSFVKSLFIHFTDNYKYTYSDNYLDLEAGDEVTIDITSKENIDISEIMFDAYKGQ